MTNPVLWISVAVVVVALAIIAAAIVKDRWQKIDRDVEWMLGDHPAAHEPDEPTLRYWVTRPSIGWHEHEITKREYIRLEHEFGWRQPGDNPDEPVTHWHCRRFTVSAWTTRDGDRGDAPTHFGHSNAASWIDPSRTIRLDDEPLRERTNCGQFASYYGPCGGCDACTDAMHAYYDGLASQPTLDAWPTPAPGDDPNREIEPVDHHRITSYPYEGPVTHTCTCGKPWPCDEVVAKVWEHR